MGKHRISPFNMVSVVQYIYVSGIVFVFIFAVYGFFGIVNVGGKLRGSSECPYVWHGGSPSHKGK